MINNMGMLLANIPVWLGIIFVAVALGAGLVCGYFVDKQVLMKKLGELTARFGDLLLSKIEETLASSPCPLCRPRLRQ